MVGCRLWGCTESDKTEPTYNQQYGHREMQHFPLESAVLDVSPGALVPNLGAIGRDLPCYTPFVTVLEIHLLEVLWANH